MKIGIVGLGLIGGSMAKAIRFYTDHEVFGFNRDASVQQQALSQGVLHGKLDETTLPQCDLLFIALYPKAAIDYVTSHAPSIQKGACVVDLCGIKRMVCDALDPLAEQHGFYFVGGHPMAGKERSGYAAASHDLFSGASMILVPSHNTPASLLDDLGGLFRSIGFGTICLSDAEQHDKMIAYTSQLAHVVSNAYVKSDQALLHKGFSAGSFQDMTRVAILNETMWTELCFLNHDYLAKEIEDLCKRLETYAQALRAGEEKQFFDLLHEGCVWKKKTLL